MYKKIRLLMTALLGMTVWGGTAQINGHRIERRSA